MCPDRALVGPRHCEIKRDYMHEDVVRGRCGAWLRKNPSLSSDCAIASCAIVHLILADVRRKRGLIGSIGDP